jgi:hypothetical protein
MVHDGGDSDSVGVDNRNLHQIQQGGVDHNRFTLQQVVLDTAIAPLMSRPTAPFDRTERKKAYTSAVYYSECFLHGIEPIMADTAAEEAQGKYDKWWIGSTASRRSKGDPTGDESSSHKRHSKNNCELIVGGRRIKSRTTVETSSVQERDNYIEDEMSLASRNVVSISSRFDLQDEAAGGGNVSADDDESMQGTDAEGQNVGQKVPPMNQITTLLTTTTRSYIENAKMRMIEDLRSSGGSVETPLFLECLEILQTYYAGRNLSDRADYLSELVGNWLTLSKPTYTELKGKNEKGESLYSLGRISFDMFRPSALLCSVQASFNNVESIDPKNPGRPLHVPRKLMKDIWSGECTLQTYE